MDSDEKLRTTFRVYIDQLGIINIEVTGGVNDVDSNIRQAELIDQSLKKIIAEKPDNKFKCLFSLVPIGSDARYPSSDARKIYSQMIDYPQMNRIAVVVPNLIAKSIVKFVLTAAHKTKKIELFDNAEKALKWLDEK